jgi:hypothetical protein
MSRTDLRQHAAKCTTVSPDPLEPMPQVQLDYRHIKDRATPIDALAAAGSSAALLATAEQVTFRCICAVQ